MTLILPQELSLIHNRLEPEFNEVEQFEQLLQPHIPQNLIAQQIDKPSTYQIIFEAKK